MKHLNIYKKENFNMKPLPTYITEYIIKKKLDEPIDSEYQYHPNSKEKLTKNIQELISNKIYDFNCDLSCWDVSKVEDMNSMFSFCKNFEGKGLEKWDVSNVKDMKVMFYNCENFDCDLSNWDVSKVENMYTMFEGCSKFKGKGLDNWNVSNVENMYYMFYNCKSITNKPSWYKDKE